MTKEELEKEANKWGEKNISLGVSMYNPEIESYCIEAYLAGAEPREKRIAELEAQIEELKEKSERQSKNYKNDTEVLLINIGNLEAQIDKMKCCGNCKYYNHSTTECKITKFFYSYASSCDSWQLKE